MIKRNLFATFLNTTPNGEKPTWSRLGRKVTEETVAMNPQSITEQDITQETSETELTGYQPSFPVSQKADTDDPVFVFVNDLRRKRATLDDCHTQIIQVDLYDGSADKGYKAELQDVTIAIDNYGGAAADPLSIEYTVYYDGDARTGSFNPETKTFTAD
jgi:hypothetical protein